MPKETFFNLPPEKRGKINDLAIEEFAENDYKNASISRIVARAGIAKGSFYQYFENKQDLYLYLIQRSMQEKAAFLSQNPPLEANNIFAKLRWLFTIGLGFEFSNPKLARIGFRAIYDDAPLPSETRLVIQEGSMDFFRQLVQQGKEQGSIDLEIDTNTAAYMFNMVFINLGDFILKQQKINPEQLLDEQGQVFTSPAVEKVFDQVLGILQSGLRTN